MHFIHVSLLSGHYYDTKDGNGMAIALARGLIKPTSYTTGAGGAATKQLSWDSSTQKHGFLFSAIHA